MMTAAPTRYVGGVGVWGGRARRAPYAHGMAPSPPWLITPTPPRPICPTGPPQGSPLRRPPGLLRSWPRPRHPVEPPARRPPEPPPRLLLLLLLLEAQAAPRDSQRPLPAKRPLRERPRRRPRGRPPGSRPSSWRRAPRLQPGKSLSGGEVTARWGIRCWIQVDDGSYIPNKRTGCPPSGPPPSRVAHHPVLLPAAPHRQRAWQLWGPPPPPRRPPCSPRPRWPPPGKRRARARARARDGGAARAHGHSFIHPFAQGSRRGGGTDALAFQGSEQGTDPVRDGAVMGL